MQKPRIDLDELASVMNDHASEWVLDLQTGNVLMTDWVREGTIGPNGELDIDPPLDSVDGEGHGYDLIESGRFARIYPVGSGESFRWMQSFVDAQENDRVRERLIHALHRPRPFRRFKDALMDLSEEVRSAWFRYEEQHLRAAAEEWLRESQVDAEVVDTRQPTGAR